MERTLCAQEMAHCVPAFGGSSRGLALIVFRLLGLSNFFDLVTGSSSFHVGYVYYALLHEYLPWRCAKFNIPTSQTLLRYNLPSSSWDVDVLRCNELLLLTETCSLNAQGDHSMTTDMQIKEVDR